MNEHLAGTTRLARLILRQERLALLGWITFMLFVVVGGTTFYTRVFPTEEALLEYQNEIQGNAALLAFNGQVDNETSTLGALASWRYGDTVYISAGLMALLTLIRHTRTEEESGRRELIGAAVVGRYAPLTASLIVVSGAVLLTAILSTAGLVALGIPPIGALAWGLNILTYGGLITAVSALIAQLTESSRSAIVIGAIVLGQSYLFRFAGDGTGQEWLVWLSPLGWNHLVQPFGIQQWWVLALPIIAILIIGVIAYRLVGQRDVGAGVLPPRRGPTTAPDLKNPLALAWRLQRGALMGWTLAFAIVGVFAASVGNSIVNIASVGTILQEFFRRFSEGPNVAMVDAYLWTIILSIGYLAMFYPAIAVLHLRSEETAGHAELLLSTPVGRLQWAISHITIATVGTLVIMGASGFTAGLTYGLSIGDVATQVPRLMAGALIQVPAMWVLGGIAMLLVGILPRFAFPISWALWLFFNFVGEILGPIVGIDYWIANLVVPFHYLPKILSGGEFTIIPLLGLTAVSLFFTAAGLFAFRQRDID